MALELIFSPGINASPRHIEHHLGSIGKYLRSSNRLDRISGIPHLNLDLVRSRRKLRITARCQSFTGCIQWASLHVCA